MNPKIYLLSFCSGYLYGLLLVDICLCIPVAKTDRNHFKTLRNKGLDVGTNTENQPVLHKQKLLSLMDITSFIDKHSDVANSFSSKNRNTKRKKRFAATEENELNLFYESFSADFDEKGEENPSLNIRMEPLPKNPQPDTEFDLIEKITENSTSVSSLSKSDSASNTEYEMTITRPNHNTPQYMLDLFARFQNNPFSQPASNTVRSFFNEGN